MSAFPNLLKSKFFIATSVVMIFISGAITLYAQDYASNHTILKLDDKLQANVDMSDSSETYQFSASGECATMISIISDAVETGPSLLLDNVTQSSPVAILTPKSSGATFRLPPGDDTYRVSVNYNGILPEETYLISLEKDCSHLITTGAEETVTTTVSPRTSKIVTVSPREETRTLKILPSRSFILAVPEQPVIDDNGGGDDNGGRDEDGNLITIIVRSVLTDNVLDVLSVDLKAGVALNLPAGDYAMEIINPLENVLNLDMILTADTNLGALNLINVTGDSNTSLLDLSATAGLSILEDDNTSNVSMVDTDVNVGDENALVDASVIVEGNNAVLLNVPVVKVEANAAPVVDARVTVGGENVPLVDVNVNEDGSSTPIVTVGGGNATVPVVNVNASVGGATTTPPLLDANVNVGGNNAGASVSVGNTTITIPLPLPGGN